jgi:hypothetical protein
MPIKETKMTVQKDTPESVRNAARLLDGQTRQFLNHYAELLERLQAGPSKEDVENALKAYISESGTVHSRNGDLLQIDEEAMQAALTAYNNRLLGSTK